MKASVIIPNLNGAGWLRDSIESVWAQTEQDKLICKASRRWFFPIVPAVS